MINELKIVQFKNTQFERSGINLTAGFDSNIHPYNKHKL